MPHSGSSGSGGSPWVLEATSRSWSHGLLQHGLLVHEACKGSLYSQAAKMESYTMWHDHESDIPTPLSYSVG